MLEFIILVPVSILILNIRIWLFENIFETKNKKFIFFVILLLWAISASGMVFYPNLLSLLWYTNFNFTEKSNIISINIFFWFWLYLISIISIIKLIINKWKVSKLFIINTLIFSTFFFISWFIWLKLNIETIMLYYIFVAFWEEILKFILSLSFFEKRKLVYSDIIAFSILSALWFAFFENIIYLFNSISWEESFIVALSWWLSLLVARWLVWFLVHIIFTWAIWQIQSLYKNKNLYTWISLAIAIWVWLHLFYDIMLSSWFGFIVILFLIVGYFFITYLFYNSDRMYLKESIN